MMRVIDAGFILKNKQYDPSKDLYSFDIEGPEVPEVETVNLFMSVQGRVWLEPQLPAKYSLSEQINKAFLNALRKGV